MSEPQYDMRDMDNFHLAQENRQLKARCAALEQAQAALAADWRQQAQLNRDAIPADGASRYYGNGLAWAFEKCAADLAALSTPSEEPAGKWCPHCGTVGTHRFDDCLFKAREATPSEEPQR